MKYRVYKLKKTLSFREKEVKITLEDLKYMNEKQEHREVLKIALQSPFDTEETLNRKVDKVMERVEANDRMVENNIYKEWEEAHTDRTWRDYQG